MRLPLYGEKMLTTSISAPKKVLEEIDAEAARLGVSRSEYVLRALLAYLSSSGSDAESELVSKMAEELSALRRENAELKKQLGKTTSEKGVDFELLGRVCSVFEPRLKSHCELLQKYKLGVVAETPKSLGVFVSELAEVAAQRYEEEILMRGGEPPRKKDLVRAAKKLLYQTATKQEGV